MMRRKVNRELTSFDGTNATDNSPHAIFVVKFHEVLLVLREIVFGVMNALSINAKSLFGALLRSRALSADTPGG